MRVPNACASQQCVIRHAAIPCYICHGHSHISQSRAECIICPMDTHSVCGKPGYSRQIASSAMADPGLLPHQYALTWFVYIQQDMIRRPFVQLEVVFKLCQQGFQPSRQWGL